MNIIQTGAVNHVALTVSEVRRAQEFYTDLLGFKFVADYGPRALLSNGSFILALTPPSDPSQAIEGDRFNENRIGLDHLSLGVNSIADLEAATGLFDNKGIPRTARSSHSSRSALPCSHFATRTTTRSSWPRRSSRRSG